MAQGLLFLLSAMGEVVFRSGLVSGAVALERWMELLARNLSGLEVPGYRRHVVALGSRELSSEGLPLIVEPGPIGLDLSQGELRPTGNPFDLALSGRGFFVVETPMGRRYTRSGAFSVDRDGFLVTRSGLRVMGQGGPIQLGPGALSIVVNEHGEVFLDGEHVATLMVVDFPKGTGLLYEGGGLIRAEAEPIQAEGFQVKQGFLERSNVSPVEEMARLLLLFRGFESYQKALQLHLEERPKKLLEEVLRA